MELSSSGARRPGMKDVAALARVSHQTVSRVLNAPETVAPATRERVQDAIEQLGYRRNSAARALVTQKSGLMGIIGPTQVFYGPSTIQYAVELAAHDHDYLTVNSPLESFTPEALKAAVDRLSSLDVEVIVIIEPLETALVGVDHVDARVPVVGTMSPVIGQRLGIPTATMDDMSGIRMLVEHMVSLGHTDIVHVTGAPGWFETRERDEAYRHEAATRGLDLRLMPAHSWDAADSYALALELPLEEMPTAFLADNDDLAAGLLRGLQERGVRVPQDVSVVGFDDAPGAEFLYPSLTTIRQDFSKLGKALVELAQELAERGKAQDVKLPVELIARLSSGPARSGKLV